MSNTSRRVLAALQIFAQSVSDKLGAHAAGGQEAQLHVPISNFVTDLGDILGRSVLVQAESQAPDRIGIPDFAVIA